MLCNLIYVGGPRDGETCLSPRPYERTRDPDGNVYAADAEVRRLLGAPAIDPRVEFIGEPPPLTAEQQAAVEPWPWEEKP